MTDECHPNTADFERRFFSDTDGVSIQIRLLKETYQDMVAIIEQNGWDLEKGFRTLLAQGFAYVKGQSLCNTVDKEHSLLLKRLMELESMTAVLKFEAFHLMRDNQALEIRESALRNADKMSRFTIDRLRAENDALRNELDILRAEVGKLYERNRALEASAVIKTPVHIQMGRKARWRGLLKCLRQTFISPSKGANSAGDETRADLPTRQRALARNCLNGILKHRPS